MQESTTHCLLLKTTDSFATGTDVRWLEVLRAHFACEITLQSVATVKAENNQPMHHVYLHFEKPLQLNPEDMLAVEKIWHSLSGHKADVSRLQLAMRRSGTSHESPRVHYVVETDPEEGWHDEIFRWYDQEHMPGLAEVPGSVMAQRFLNLDHAPLSFACYDLTHADVLTSAAWLAVRASAWSDICRPHFTNTLRTLFETVHTSMQRK
jgi:hypothetical protein